MAAERFPYQSSGEREGDGQGRVRKEKRECEERENGEKEGGDETDIHSKRVLALVILVFFCSAV